MPLLTTLAAASVRGFQSPGPNIPADAKILTILDILKLRDGLKLCLDAGDAASYPGTGQTWSDVSGAGSHFYRGAGSGSGADDPTFVGTAGNKNAYFSFDGGDRFQIIGSNPAWIESVHKAGFIGGFAGWVYVTNIIDDYIFFGTSGYNFAQRGFIVGYHSGGDGFNFQCTNGAGGPGVYVSGNKTPRIGWNFFSVSKNEQTVDMRLNDEVFSGSAAPLNPLSTLAATYPAQISGMSPMPANSRIASIMAWQGAAPRPLALSQFYKATRARYGV